MGDGGAGGFVGAAGPAGGSTPEAAAAACAALSVALQARVPRQTLPLVRCGWVAFQTQTRRRRRLQWVTMLTTYIETSRLSRLEVW